MLKTLNLKIIRLDGGTQMRAQIDQSAVDDYAEVLAGDGSLPPVTVFHDGAEFWLAGGFHRYHAHVKAGRASITAEVHTGTQRDAMLYAAGDNHDHGLRRTAADKRKAVTAMLTDPEWSQWSDRAIADKCHVGRMLVGEVRTELSERTTEIEEPADEQLSERTTEPTKVRGKDGKTYDRAAKRGRETEQPAAGPAQHEPAEDAETKRLRDLNAELQAFNTDLLEQIQAAEADDLKAEAIKWRRATQHAQRQQSEAMERASQARDREAMTMKIVKRCCKALDVDDPAKLAPIVEAMARKQKVAA